jgi:Distinct helicase family with a unique C-terminal domain including a metal-binding cysteine cluster
MMTITLEKSLENRDHVIESVREEIIGPSRIRSDYKLFNAIGNTVFESKDELYKPRYWIVGGEKEEILQRESPTQRYVSGLLFPLGTKTEDENRIERVSLEEGKVEYETTIESMELTDFKETSEPEGEVELFAQRSDFMPSTMGLSFCIDNSVNHLLFRISGGIYIPHKVRVKGESGFYEWWLRQGVQGSVEIDTTELLSKKEMNREVFLFNKKGEKITNLNIYLQIRIRKIGQSYIITASVTNRSDISLRKELQILFQAELSVHVQVPGHFNFYPKQYQVKEFLTEEEASTELLYRMEGIYAIGHGCAATWDQHSKEIREIKTTFMPEYESISMTPDIEINGSKIKILMSDLAGLSSRHHPKIILHPLIQGYEDWITTKELEIPRLPALLQSVARKHIELCRESLNRMKKGLELLEDPQILRAFQLANLAVLLQQENGKYKRIGIVDNMSIVYDYPYHAIVKDDQSLRDATNSWRAFQIAFFLVSIESLAIETSATRNIVDLIWFPTGGGKTEAYLGVAAFQMILRRLRNPQDAGVDVIMRYTLRLLTADQFQRSSRLICALEYIRQKNSDLGDVPFSIGIWVGSKITPNRNSEAKIMLTKLRKRRRDGKEFIVHNCPWCGANLGYYNKKGSEEKIYYGYKFEDETLIIHCPDKHCHFHNQLPIWVVDESIYRHRPTFLIGTIDKFVQLVWEPRARSLFGLDWEGNRVFSPPNLIIQDELHLISGPLGTLAGLFEVLIEELCLKKVDDQTIKPKIIAATATIKQFEEQALALFGREESRLFPSPGLEHDDSFFSKPALDDRGNLMPGRKYVGVYTTTVRIMMAQVMTFSAILQAVTEIEEDQRDPYWTLLAFYNTLRELGGGLTLTQTDITQYSRAIQLRKGKGQLTRYLNHVLELTSRKQSHEIASAIDQLKTIYDPNRKGLKTIDICLASNIIEVGVDIDRLSTMAIVGQPKMTAQYIQVSGRVGRRWWERPGVIFTLYSNTKSRDKSHFEHFREYHQRLYAQVESTSVTPFSDSCLDRGLHAVVVGFLRQALTSGIARAPDWNEIQKHMKTKIGPFYDRLIERVKLVDAEQVDEVKKRFRNILSRLKNGGYTSWKVDTKVKGYMYPAGTIIPEVLRNGAESMINTMRNVDPECRGLITSFYQDNQEFDEGSWEDLFL